MPALPALAVEVNFQAATSTALIFGDAVRGKFGTGTFGGGMEWVDVTPYVRAGSITRGSSRLEGVIARAEAGKATVVLDNRDARFDPTNLAGPYVVAGASQVQPMRAWRIRADGYDLWRGFADSWTLDYPLNGRDAVCTLTGTDATKVLANDDRPAVAPVGAGETTGARIARILDAADWPAADRDLDVGQTTVQATTLAQPAWTEILLTADTEVGEVWVDGAGRVVFRNRHAVLTEARSINPQATFGDDPLDPSELGYVGLVLAHDDDQIANLVRIARVGGTEQIAEDLASQVRYLTRTFSRSDLIHETDAESAALAGYVLSVLKDADLRFDSIAFEPQGDPAALYPHALGRELGDRVQIIRRPPGREGDPIVRDCLIRGIAHAWTKDSWSTSWALQDASRLAFLVLDHAVLGRLDFNRLAF